MRGIKCLYSNIWLISTLLITFAAFVNAIDEAPGCPETDFISCVTRLRLRRVPFDKNMLNVVFNVTTEAKLRHTCMAYTDILPCFRDKIVRCGNDRQKRMLDEVAKMVRFLCSSITKEKQSLFLKHVQCIGRLLQMPVSADCELESRPDFGKIVACRQECSVQRDFLCMLRVWVSEQSLCTLIDIQKTCGLEAANFYEELQTNVFNEEFPIVCATNSSNSAPSANRVTSPHDMPTFPTIAPRTTTTIVVPTQNSMSRVLHSVPDGRVLYSMGTTTSDQRGTTGDPWWEYPILSTHSNVYNPGDTTTTIAPTTTSGTLWQKWMQLILPSSPTISMPTTTVPPPTVTSTLSTRRRPEQPSTFSTWRPWYLGGSIGGEYVGVPSTSTGVASAQVSTRQGKSMEEFKNEVTVFDTIFPHADSGPITALNGLNMSSGAGYVQWNFLVGSVLCLICLIL